MPVIPAGTIVASYATYDEAQRAVDYLSDNRFPVETCTILGSDLKSVERVTGRLTWGRAALSGVGTGAWFGLFVALVLGLFVDSQHWLRFILGGVLYGGLFGLVFGLAAYAFTGGRRDFTSVRAVTASRYEVLVTNEQADRAQQMLSGMR